MELQVYINWLCLFPFDFTTFLLGQCRGKMNSNWGWFFFCVWRPGTPWDDCQTPTATRVAVTFNKIWHQTVPEHCPPWINWTLRFASMGLEMWLEAHHCHLIEYCSLWSAALHPVSPLALSHSLTAPLLYLDIVGSLSVDTRSAPGYDLSSQETSSKRYHKVSEPSRHGKSEVKTGDYFPVNLSISKLIHLWSLICIEPQPKDGQ